MKKGKYNVEDILKILNEHSEFVATFYNYENNESTDSLFNAIYYDNEVKKTFNCNEICVTYNDGYDLCMPTPISHIIEITKIR